MEETAESSSAETTTHPALIELKRLFANNTITQKTYNNLYSKFFKLNNAFISACDQEKRISRKTSELSQKLKEQKHQIENSVESQQDSRTRLSELRQIVTNYQAELDANESRMAEIAKNTAMKEKELEKLKQKIERNQQETEEKVTGIQKQFADENNELAKSIENKKKEIQSLIDENKSQVEKIDKMNETLASLSQKKKEVLQKLNEIRAIPERIHAQCTELTQKNLKLLTDEKEANTKYGELCAKHTKYLRIIEENEDIINSLHENIEQTRKETIELKIQMDETSTKIQNCEEKKSSLLLDRIHYEKMIKEEAYTQSCELAKTNELSKKIHATTNKCLSFEEAIAKASSEKSILEKQTNNMKLELNESAKTNKQFASQLDDLAKKNEELARQLLASTGVSKELMKQITDTIKLCDEKQAQIEKLIVDERELNTMLNETSLIRDRKAREYAQMVRKAADYKAKAQERHLDYLDLCKKAEQIAVKQADITALYETVKIDRNRFVSAVQSSSQLIVELHEKIKIVESESSVLTVELSKSEIELKRLKSDLQNAYKKRERSLDELGKAMIEYKNCEQQIDSQVAETERMSKLLQVLETQISTQQQRYTISTEDCMNKRRLLIDKQDALCILNEQLNQSEAILKEGEKKIKERDEEIRLLKQQLNDFSRNIELMYKKIPKIEEYKAQIKELKWEIANEEKAAKELTKKLESPEQNGRKRNYTGTDISMAQLNKKIAFYQQRISEKDQQIWEAQVLYKDIKDKNENLVNNMKTNERAFKKASKKGGRSKADLMRINRKTKAAKSELAVMAATKLELQERKQQIEEEKIDSARRVKNGEAFDEHAEKMVRMHERDEMLSARRRKEWFDEEEEEPHGRQKYDAYPTSDGLSRPYGGFPVFQPQAPASNLRYYKREKEPEIKL